MVTDELQNIDQNNEVECYTVVSIVAVWELIKPIYDFYNNYIPSWGVVILHSPLPFLPSLSPTSGRKYHSSSLRCYGY